MATHNNELLTRSLYKNFFNDRDTTYCKQVVCHQVRVNDPTFPNGHLQGVDHFLELDQKYCDLLHHREIRIDDLIASDDKVVVYSICYGVINKNSQADLEQKIKIPGVSIYRFMNGKIVEIWQLWDRWGIIQQSQQHPELVPIVH